MYQVARPTAGPREEWAVEIHAGIFHVKIVYAGWSAVVAVGVEWQEASAFNHHTSAHFLFLPML